MSNFMHKFVDEMYGGDAMMKTSAELDWSSEEMLDQATSYIAQNTHLDDLTSIMSCKPPFTSSLDTPSEALWDKFDLLNYVLADDSPLDSLDEEDLLPEVRLSSSLESNPSPISEMRHHDCMWAGYCRHEEHGDADSIVTPPSSPTFDVCSHVPTVTKPAAVPRSTNKRSLLAPRPAETIPSKVFAATKTPYQDIGHRPETPVSDFDESFQSMKNVCYSTNEDEDEDSETDSIQSSESEENDDCLEEEDEEEEVETTVVDSRYVNHGTSYLTDHTYGRPPFRQPDTSNLGLCTPSDSEEEIDVVSLQPLKMPETTTIVEEQQCTPAKRAKMTPTKRSARQSARAARASTLASKRNSQSHDFQEELHQSLAAMAAEAAKEVVPPLRLRLQHSSGGKRRKSAMSTPPSSSSSGNSSDSSSSSDDTPMPKRGPKRSRMSKKLTSSSSRKRSSCSSAARSSSDSEDRSGKRTMHNTMERQRRVDLRNAFETLRQYIPDLLNSEKAPKVTILREASNFCMELQQEEARLERHRNALRKEQAALSQRLAQARRNHASARR